MIWMVIGLNLGLSGLCLWTVAKLLRIRRSLRRTNRTLSIAIHSSNRVFSAAPSWWDTKQASLLNLHALVAQYGTYWQQLQKTYHLLLLVQKIWPKQRFVLAKHGRKRKIRVKA